MQKVFDLHLRFLQISQAAAVHLQAFAALRAFIHKVCDFICCVLYNSLRESCSIWMTTLILIVI